MMVARFALVLILASAQLPAQIIADRSLIDPAATVIDFESFAVGPVANPLTIGNVTFSAGPGLGIVDVSPYGANGTEVNGKNLLPYSSGSIPLGVYTPTTIAFSPPVSEVGLGWFDPNFTTNRLRAFDSNGTLLAEGTPALFPSGGGGAASCPTCPCGRSILSDPMLVKLAVPRLRGSAVLVLFGNSRETSTSDCRVGVSREGHTFLGPWFSATTLPLLTVRRA